MKQQASGFDGVDGHRKKRWLREWFSRHRGAAIADVLQPYRQAFGEPISMLLVDHILQTSGREEDPEFGFGGAFPAVFPSRFSAMFPATEPGEQQLLQNLLSLMGAAAEFTSHNDPSNPNLSIRRIGRLPHNHSRGRHRHGHGHGHSRNHSHAHRRHSGASENSERRADSSERSPVDTDWEAD